MAEPTTLDALSGAGSKHRQAPETGKRAGKRAGDAFTRLVSADGKASASQGKPRLIAQPSGRANAEAAIKRAAEAGSEPSEVSQGHGLADQTAGTDNRIATRAINTPKAPANAQTLAPESKKTAEGQTPSTKEDSNLGGRKGAAAEAIALAMPVQPQDRQKKPAPPPMARAAEAQGQAAAAAHAGTVLVSEKAAKALSSKTALQTGSTTAAADRAEPPVAAKAHTNAEMTSEVSAPPRSPDTDARSSGQRLESEAARAFDPSSTTKAAGSFAPDAGQARTPPPRTEAPPPLESLASGSSVQGSKGVGSQTAPATASTAAPSGGATANAMAPQMAEPIRLAVQRGADHIQIRLEPAELGRVDIRFETANGTTQVQITADNQQTLDMLRRDQVTLERLLQQSGMDLKDGGLSFARREQAQTGGGERQTAGRIFSLDGDAESAPATEDTPSATRQARIGDGLIDVNV